MSDDIIEIIRARHLRDDRWRNLPSMICPQAHDDRATLLIEVERLREVLREALCGLQYWVPQTEMGSVEKSRIMGKVEKTLEVKP